MAVALQVRKMFDRAARLKQARSETSTGGTDFWALVDAAGDEPFENRLKGTSLTQADAALETDDVWDQVTVREIFILLQTYLQYDLALASPPLDTWLAKVAGFRVPHEAAEIWARVFGATSRPLARNVFPKGTLPADEEDAASAGMHHFGTLTGTLGASTYAAVDGPLNIAKVVAAPVLCVSRELTPGADPTMKVVLGDETTTKNISVAASAAANGQAIVGRQAITSVTPAAGETGPIIGVAATAQFTAGDYVLLYENADGDSSQRELAKVKSIAANTSLELQFDETGKTDLVNTFTTSGLVLPMFTDVSAFVSTNISNGKHLDFYALPDRIIAL